MIELTRIVEHQASLSSYRATQNFDRAIQLELLIESTKPKNSHIEWHPLIATPFRYTPPHSEARFRPRYGKNIFYGSCFAETALYEHAFHFMKQRIHLKIKTETGLRTLFSVDALDHHATEIKSISNSLSILDKNDYSSSHQFIAANPAVSFIIYPSCRDPQQRNNAAILDINFLNKTLNKDSSIKFFYDNSARKITWLDYKLPIHWNQVV